MELLDCHECGDQFMDLKEYFMHRTLHHNLISKTSTDMVKRKDWSFCPICPKRKTTSKCSRELLKSYFKALIHGRDFKYIRGKKLRQCELCHRVFVSHRDLNSHMETHNPNRKRFTCEICCKDFFKSHALNKHYMRCHKMGGAFKCEQCLKTFITEKGLRMHEFVHKQDNWVNIREITTEVDDKSSVECPECHKVFACRKYYNVHKSRVHDVVEKKFACDMCPKRFSIVYDLKRHKRVHNDDLCWKCSYCDKRYCTRDARDRHVERNHTTVRTLYTCDMCPKAFVNKSNLNSHRKIHTDDCFKCLQCGKKYGIKSEYTKHIKRHFNSKQPHYNIYSENHINPDDLKGDKEIPEGKIIQKQMRKSIKEEEKHQCKICSKLYASHKILKKHETLHNMEKKFKCIYCNVNLKYERTLQSHIRNHHPDRVEFKFECDVCCRRFVNERRLDEHRTVHKERQFLYCSHCPKRFLSRSSYRLHNSIKHDIAIDNIPQTIKCSQCKEEFSDRNLLKEHRELVHRDNIEVNCLYCTKVFPGTKALRMHTRGEHPSLGNSFNDKLLQCLICKIKFKSHEFYKEHINEVHDITILE